MLQRFSVPSSAMQDHTTIKKKYFIFIFNKICSIVLELNPYARSKSYVTALRRQARKPLYYRGPETGLFRMRRCESEYCSVFFLICIVGGGIKVHSTLRPLNGLLYQPRVIMIMEKSVE
jgi:hypothetical protein